MYRSAENDIKLDIIKRYKLCRCHILIYVSMNLALSYMIKKKKKVKEGRMK